MRPGREIDTRIATEVFGYKVWARGKVLYENPPQGERPLRSYSKDIEWAWTVAEKMKISMIPVAGGHWFAFVGPEEKAGWESPLELSKTLDAGDFAECGAFVGDQPALVICMAALKAMEKRQSRAESQTTTDSAKSSDEKNPPELH
jgi:hypothetical protein